VITIREKTTAYVLLSLFALISIVPILGVVLLAFNAPDTQVSGFTVPDGIHFETFRAAWNTAQFSLYLRSSVIVVIAVVSGATLLSILSGYAFGVMRFRGQTVLFYLLLVGMIVPFEVVIVPLYYDLRDYNLTDTYWSIILPQIALDVAFGTYWMRAYFRSVSPALLDAAAIDGAGSWRTLWRVIMPNARPAVLTLVLLLFMWSWNDFLTALVMVQSDHLRTAPLGLAFFAGQHSTDRVGMSAAALMVATPVVVVFIALQRHFVAGLAGGAVKE
jgi:raffinose/stachyose/melibiose transport system permease protein